MLRPEEHRLFLNLALFYNDECAFNTLMLMLRRPSVNQVNKQYISSTSARCYNDHRASSVTSSYMYICSHKISTAAAAAAATQVVKKKCQRRSSARLSSTAQRRRRRWRKSPPLCRQHLAKRDWSYTKHKMGVGTFSQCTQGGNQEILITAPARDCCCCRCTARTSFDRSQQRLELALVL